MTELYKGLFQLFLGSWAIFLLSGSIRILPARGAFLYPLLLLLALCPLFALVPSSVIILSVIGLSLLQLKTTMSAQGSIQSSGATDKWFWAIVILCLFEFLFFVTYGEFFIFGAESFGASFDSLGYHLLHGESEVAKKAISWEGFFIGDKVYMYFGPVPSFLRILLNALSQNHVGMWSRLSVFIAACYSFLALVLISHRELVCRTDLPEMIRVRLLRLLTLGFGAGTPIIFLTSCSFIYHEANIWGLCWSVWSLYFLIPLVQNIPGQKENDEATWRNLFFFCTCAGFALLSRVTFSIPLFFIIAGIGLYLIVRDRRISKHLIMALMPAILAFSFQLWYNNSRFSSPLAFNDFRYYKALIGPDKKSVFEIGGLFLPSRIPFAVGQYLTHFSDTFSTKVPFVRAHEATGFIPGTYPQRFENGPQMRLVTVPVVSGWLLLLSICGFLNLVKHGSWIERLSSSAFLIQVGMILSYYWVCQRYQSEFIPILTLGAVYCIRYMKVPMYTFKYKILSSLFVFLTIFCSLATFCSTIEYVSTYRGGVPAGYPERLKEIFGEIQGVLF